MRKIHRRLLVADKSRQNPTQAETAQRNPLPDIGGKQQRTEYRRRRQSAQPRHQLDSAALFGGSVTSKLQQILQADIADQ